MRSSKGFPRISPAERAQERIFSRPPLPNFIGPLFYSFRASRQNTRFSSKGPTPGPHNFVLQKERPYARPHLPNSKGRAGCPTSSHSHFCHLPKV
ncbi:unnamed protein product [Prunus armeniaca]